MCDIKQKNKNGMPYVGMVIALLVVQRLVSILGGVVADVFTYEAIDPFSLFGWISVHHIVQMATALIIILPLGILLKHDFGFSMGEKKFGMKAVGFLALCLRFIMTPITPLYDKKLQ